MNFLTTTYLIPRAVNCWLSHSQKKNIYRSLPFRCIRKSWSLFLSHTRTQYTCTRISLGLKRNWVVQYSVQDRLKKFKWDSDSILKWIKFESVLILTLILIEYEPPTVIYLGYQIFFNLLISTQYKFVDFYLYIVSSIFDLFSI